MKSLVRLNAERDPSYKPYCMRCSGLTRMQIVEHLEVELEFRHARRQVEFSLDERNSQGRRKLMNDIIANPKDAQAAIAALTKDGYDTASIYRFACAARSWSVRDSEQWKIWKEVEKLTSAPDGAS